MHRIRFEWDRNKAALNMKRHNITFEEASTVFRDNLAVIFEDKDHSEQELRELMIGHSNRNRLLVISFTERGDAIRLISDRRANNREQAAYEQAKR